MSVSLLPRTEERILKKIESGPYQSADDVVAAALALLDDRERRLHTLREKLRVGIDSGEGFEYSPTLMDEIEREAEEAFRRGDKPDSDVLP